MSDFDPTPDDAFAAADFEERGFAARPRRIDTFTTVVAAVDLFLSGLRFLLVPLAFVGLAHMTPDDPMRPTVPFEVATGIGIGVFGLAADILLLCRRRLGVTLGWLALAFVVMSLGVAAWQITAQTEKFPPGEPAFVGLIVGAGVVAAIRVALAVLYGVALVRAGRSLAAA